MFVSTQCRAGGSAHLPSKRVRSDVTVVNVSAVRRHLPPAYVREKGAWQKWRARLKVGEGSQIKMCYSPDILGG